MSLNISNHFTLHLIVVFFLRLTGLSIEFLHFLHEGFGRLLLNVFLITLHFLVILYILKIVFSRGIWVAQ